MADYRYGIDQKDPGGITEGINSLADFLQKKNQFNSKQSQEIELARRKELQDRAMQELVGTQQQSNILTTGDQSRQTHAANELVDQPNRISMAQKQAELAQQTHKANVGADAPYKLAEIQASGAQQRLTNQQSKNLEHQLKVQQLQNEIDQYTKLHGQYPDASIDVGQLRVDPYARLVKEQANQERHDKNAATQLEHYGKRNESEGVPMAMSGFANLEQGTADPSKGTGGILTDPNYQVKSAGPFANIIRKLPILGQTALNIGESIGAMPEGAAKEQALIQRLFNIDTKRLSGTAVSLSEEGRQMIEKGMAAGGDPNLVKIGIKQMYDAIESSSANIDSSTIKEIRDLYKSQGGRSHLEDFIGKKPNMQLPGQSQGIAPQQPKQSQNQPQTVIQNGHTYTLNPQTGQYE